MAEITQRFHGAAGFCFSNHEARFMRAAEELFFNFVFVLVGNAARGIVAGKTSSTRAAQQISESRALEVRGDRAKNQKQKNKPKERKAL